MRLKLALLVVLAVVCMSCSATKQISAEAQAVNKSAEGAIKDIAAAKDTGEVGPAAQPHLDAATNKLTDIRARSGRILSAVPNITDSTPLWYDIAWWGLVALAILGTLALAIYSGIGAVTKPAFAMFGSWLSWLIPRAKVTEAKLAAESFAAGTATPTLDKIVTAKRSDDPAFDTAFKMEKERLLHEQGT
jgi:hypothetical protein